MKSFKFYVQIVGKFNSEKDFPLQQEEGMLRDQHNFRNIEA